jgi:gas vesicle protein
MSENNGRTAACGVASFAIGAAVGAGIMLLLAPKPGQETREDIARKIGDLKEKTLAILDQTLHLFKGGRAETTVAED